MTAVDLESSADRRPGGERRGARAAWLALVLLVVGLVYAPGLENGFVWLDQAEIVEGGLIVDDLEGALALFSDDRNFAGYHRPVYNLLHSFDRWVWGLDPFGFHLSSLVLHLGNVALAFALVLRLGERFGGAPFGARGAAATALLFGLHPVNTAVAGLVHAKADLACTAGMLGAWLAVERAERGSRVPWLVVAGAAYAVALFAKETAFVVPPLAWLAARWLPAAPAEEDGDERVNVVATRGSRALTSFAMLATVLAGAVFLTRLDGLGGGQAGAGMTLDQRLGTFAGVYLGYVRKLFLPFGLTLSDTVTAFGALPLAARVGTVVGALGLVGAQVWAVLRWRPGFAWPLARVGVWVVLFHAALLPVAQIVPLQHFRADRFLYLPSLAFAALLVEGAGMVVAHARASGEDARRVARQVLACGAIVALVSGALVLRRLPAFASDDVLFADELQRTPDYREGFSVLARTWDRAGRFEQAAPLYERALQDYPGRISYLDVAGTLLGFSHNLLVRGELERAEEVLELAEGRVTRPRHRDEIAYNLAVVAYRRGEHATALEGLERYAERYPSAPSPRYLIGRCALALGDLSRARSAFEAYLQLAPEAPDREEVVGFLDDLARDDP